METSAEHLPVDVALTALTSRLGELQVSRIGEINNPIQTPPDPSNEAAKRQFIASRLISELERRLEAGELGFVSVGVLYEDIAPDIPDLSPEELNFVVRFLNMDREIRYITGNVNKEFSQRSTRAWTRLVRYQPRHDRVKLTDAGRLLIRLIRRRDSWLFEDKEIEKLVQALHSGLFDQVPKIANNSVMSIRELNLDLARITERPNQREIVDAYLERKEHISGMISRCLRSAHSGIELLNTEEIRDRHELWVESQQYEARISLGELAEIVSRVHRATESLSRNWDSLLGKVAENKRALIGVMRFDRFIDHYLSHPPKPEIDDFFLDGVFGWGRSTTLHSVMDVAGSLPPEVAPPTKRITTYNISETVDQRKLRRWLTKHQDAILAKLSSGEKVTLKQFVTEGRIDVQSSSDIAALMGLYVVGDSMGKQHRLVVETRGDEFVQFDRFHHRFTVTDMCIRLADGDNS